MVVGDAPWPTETGLSIISPFEPASRQLTFIPMCHAIPPTHFLAPFFQWAASGLIIRGPAPNTILPSPESAQSPMVANILFKPHRPVGEIQTCGWGKTKQPHTYFSIGAGKGKGTKETIFLGIQLPIPIMSFFPPFPRYLALGNGNV